MRIHLAEGNLAEAATAYERVGPLLWKKLGVSPTLQMAQLVRDFRARMAAERPSSHSILAPQADVRMRPAFRYIDRAAMAFCRDGTDPFRAPMCNRPA